MCWIEMHPGFIALLALIASVTSIVLTIIFRWLDNKKEQRKMKARLNSLNGYGRHGNVGNEDIYAEKKYLNELLNK